MKFSSWLSSLRRVIRWHRRGLGALAAAVCLVGVLMALSPVGSESRTVLVASGPLPAGTTLAAEHLGTVQAPAGLVPEGALGDTGQALGQVLAAPRPAGSILTVSDLVGSGLLNETDGMSLVPFRLADGGVASLLAAGDLISVVGSSADGSTRTIASQVRIAAIQSAGSSGALGTVGSSEGALVIVTAPQQTARELSAASSQYTLSVVLEGS